MERPESDERLANLREGVRIAERTIDHQVQLIKEEHLKTEHLVRLGVATLAGKIAVIGLILNAGLPVGFLGSIWFAVGIVAVCAAIVQLFRIIVYVGSESHMHIGVDIAVMLQQLTERQWAATGMTASVLAANAAAFELNGNVLLLILRRRAVGASLLIAGVFTHLIALAYIARGAILG